MKLMDRVRRYGLWTLTDTPRFKLSQGDLKGLRDRYEAFSNHPSALFHYEEESLIHGHATYENGKKWHDLLREVAPNQLICMADWLHVKDKATDPRPADGKKAYGEDRRLPDELCDVGVDYWYPFPLPKGQTELVVPDWLKFNMDTKKPMWVAPQSVKRHWMAPEQQGWPKPEEYRVQAYLSIIHGAKGLFYFGAHIYKEREAGHFEYLKKLVGELRDNSPIFLAPTSRLKIEMTGGTKISTLLKEYQGAYYLIAASRDVPAVKVAFKLPFKPASIEVVNENRKITPHGNGFQDKFSRYAVHIYEIRK